MDKDLLKNMMKNKMNASGKMGNLGKNGVPPLNNNPLNKMGGLPSSPGSNPMTGGLGGALGGAAGAAGAMSNGQSGQGEDEETQEQVSPVGQAANNAKEAAMDAAGEAAKKNAKKVAGKVALAVGPYIIIGILIVILGTVIVMYPSVLIKEGTQKVMSAFDKVGNVVSGNGFRESSRIVSDKLEKARKNYTKASCAIKNSRCYEGTFDDAIILSTFHTNSTVDPENYEIDVDALGDGNYFKQFADSVVDITKTNAFYKVQDDMMGSAEFDDEVFKKERGMLYYLVDYKVGWACADSKWDGFWATADTVSDLMSHSSYKLSYLGGHLLTDFNPLWPKNIILDFIGDVWNYGLTGNNYIVYATKHGLYSEDDLTKKHLFSQIFAAPTVTCGEGQSYYPYLIRYSNYETYFHYIKDIYVPTIYFDCFDCQKYTQEEKLKLTVNTMYEICDQRNYMAASIENSASGKLICDFQIENNDIKITAYLEETDGPLRGDLASLILPPGSTGFNGEARFYSQTDYADYEYYGPGSSSTIKSSGCGPTSLSIVISSILGEDHDPVELTNLMCNQNNDPNNPFYPNKLCTPNDGSYRSAMASVPPVYGLKSESVGYNSEGVQRLIDALSTGNAMAIAIMGPGHFTNGGHFIVLSGVNDQGQVFVLDPYNGEKRGHNTWWDLNVIVSENDGNPGSNAFWIITKE